MSTAVIVKAVVFSITVAVGSENVVRMDLPLETDMNTCNKVAALFHEVSRLIGVPIRAKCEPEAPITDGAVRG